MKRFFNTTGFCTPEKHYMVEPLRGILKEFSGGQPWLTNALANEIIVKMLGEDFTKTIQPEMVETAKERLIAARQTHLDSLADKLKEDRVRKVVMAIVSGDAPPLR